MMSTLQIGLGIVGAVLLALIAIYNAWITRRNAPKRATMPQDMASRAGSGLREDPFLEVDATAELENNLQGLDQGPETASQALDGQNPAPVLPVYERRAGLDPLIDAIAILQPDSMVFGEAALAVLPSTRRAGSKPFSIEAWNESTQQWEAPIPGQRYQCFQAGVQLANRMGALNEIEFSEFVMKAQAFADAINATPDFPDMLQEVARARELDQFASEHDAQLAFTLRAYQAAWSPGYVQQNAARLGFVAGAMPGRLVLPAPVQGMPPILSLAYDTQAALSDDPDQSAIREITLSLDVAQVYRAEQPFARLREIGAVLCEVMDGVLCDSNGQPLPAMAMDPIAADLELLYDQLDSRELSAGSVLARRLFS